MVRKPTGIPAHMMRQFHVRTQVMPEQLNMVGALMPRAKFRHPEGRSARSLVELLERTNSDQVVRP